MAIREDIYQYLSDYRGILRWLAYTETYTNIKVPQIDIALYIKEGPIPMRKGKITEISTIRTLDPGTHMETTTQAIFYGPPDILQQEISGWTITPTSNSQWAPTDASGNPLNWGQLSYNDIIGYFIEGRLNRNKAGAWTRKDPDVYITPRGQSYLNPYIASFQPSAAPVMKKQPFDMILYLES